MASHARPTWFEEAMDTAMAKAGMPLAVGTPAPLGEGLFSQQTPGMSSSDQSAGYATPDGGQANAEQNVLHATVLESRQDASNVPLLGSPMTVQVANPGIHASPGLSMSSVVPNFPSSMPGFGTQASAGMNQPALGMSGPSGLSAGVSPPGVPGHLSMVGGTPVTVESLMFMMQQQALFLQQQQQQNQQLVQLVQQLSVGIANARVPPPPPGPPPSNVPSQSSGQGTQPSSGGIGGSAMKAVDAKLIPSMPVCEHAKWVDRPTTIMGLAHG